MVIFFILVWYSHVLDTRGTLKVEGKNLKWNVLVFIFTAEHLGSHQAAVSLKELTL